MMKYVVLVYTRGGQAWAMLLMQKEMATKINKKAGLRLNWSWQVHDRIIKVENGNIVTVVLFFISKFT